MLHKTKNNPAGLLKVELGVAGLLWLCAFAPALHAQDKNPFAGDSNAATIGASQFRANCAFCHGLGARGGGRGPDLTRAQKKHGNGDADMFRTINEGVPGTAMPHVLYYRQGLQKPAYKNEKDPHGNAKMVLAGVDSTEGKFQTSSSKRDWSSRWRDCLP